MRYHHQNLTDGVLPLWRHGRAWLWRLHWGWGVFHPSSLLLLGLGRDGMCIYLRAFHFYLTWGDTESERGRWEIWWSDGALRIEHPWVRQDGWDRRDPWWKHALRIPVVDWLLGKVRYESVAEAPVEVFVPMPEGCYRAIATPSTRTWRRRSYWPMRRVRDVSIEIPGGIPFSGKGENSWDCGDDGLFGLGGDNIEDAIANCVRSVLRSRRRHGHDSAMTGAAPAIVLNDARFQREQLGEAQP